MLCADGQTEAIPNLVGMLARSEVVRQVTEVFCLERVAVGDVVTARSLLATIIQVQLLCLSLELMTPWFVSLSHPQVRGEPLIGNLLLAHLLTWTCTWGPTIR